MEVRIKPSHLFSDLEVQVYMAKEYDDVTTTLEWFTLKTFRDTDEANDFKQKLEKMPTENPTFQELKDLGLVF